ncbi:MAG: hypothetical protein Q4A75_02455 [Peptostreptococcaceae bacterium]|nr:hypothetical protein [Peptostreptococcaceae bacterium]
MKNLNELLWNKESVEEILSEENPNLEESSVMRVACYELFSSCGGVGGIGPEPPRERPVR